MDSETEQDVISIVTDLTFLASSTDWDSEVASLITQLFSGDEKKNRDLIEHILSRKAKMEFASLTSQIKYVVTWRSESAKKLLSLTTKIISLVSSMDLDSESDLVSLIKQIISLFNSKPDSDSELVALITRTVHLGISVEPTQESKLLSLISQLVSLKPEPELTSLIRHIISRFKSMNWEPRQFIYLGPQVQLECRHAMIKEYHGIKKQKGKCCLSTVKFWSSPRKKYFHCRDCNGENHKEEYEKAPLETKHPLHPKHSLQLTYLDDVSIFRGPSERRCYCCDQYTFRIIYFCQACNYTMDVTCVDKPPLLATDHPKWHDHTLALFPSQASFPCNICALTHSRCPFYICPPCDFVVHQDCLSLPRVIRISRHPHRISFTPSFDKGNWLCGICRKKINNDYGGYSCSRKGCVYAAHSRCATQSNVWDGEDLDGVPEEIEEEELQPFVRIRDGIIQHFSHQQHNLKLDEDTSRDYDENKLCRACITPIYLGNFYSCVECEFILHESCANLSRKLYHPIHPHLLTLVTDNMNGGQINDEKSCTVCPRLTTGFFYECSKIGCHHPFRVHVQCATISEPLVHHSHTHPLFLTSKPGEHRTCRVCKESTPYDGRETFNCIECDFSLCFECATIPYEVRYKHDKHMLTLSYGKDPKEVSILEYWCEACERKIEPKELFYKCEEYCCVTIHMECLIGKDFYMKPGLSVSFFVDQRLNVMSHNHPMSRPICCECKNRCSQKVVFEYSRSTFCSTSCAELCMEKQYQSE